MFSLTDNSNQMCKNLHFLNADLETWAMHLNVQTNTLNMN